MDPASLDLLHDIVVPPPVGWWPPAPGWYVILFTTLALLLVAVIWVVVRWRANAYRRTAIRELQTLQQDAQDKPPAEVINAVASLVKRVALAAYPRAEVASLSGPEWVAWLNQHGKDAVWCDDAASLLAESRFRNRSCAPPDHAQCAALLEAAQTWVKLHRAATMEEKHA
ncbi:MAG: DUF4381 domain-containing protein [Planctomycetota bacterium]|jgi:hypothetical protein